MVEEGEGEDCAVDDGREADEDEYSDVEETEGTEAVSGNGIRNEETSLFREMQKQKWKDWARVFRYESHCVGLR